MSDILSILQEKADVFILAGDLDLESAQQLEPLIKASAERTRTIVFDVSALSFMDSSGISLLARFHREHPFTCVFVHGASSAVARVLELTGIDELPGFHVDGCRH